MTRPADNDLVRLLVVEDEPDLCEAMVSFLALHGLDATGVGTLGAANDWLQSHPVDIVVLDVGLPDMNGIDWLRQRAPKAAMGIVIVTANGQLPDRLRGLDAGADAYLVKPVEFEELLAVTRNLARRLGVGQPAPPSRWQLDSVGWVLHSPQGQAVRLTRSEAVVVELLAAQPGRAVARAELAQALGHLPQLYDPRRLEILMRRLRRKVEEQTGQPLPLETVHGLGYAFAGPITRSDAPA